MVWAAVSWYSAGPIDTLHGRITARDYMDRLAYQVHPMIQTLFRTTQFSNTVVPPLTAGTVQAWFEEPPFSMASIVTRFEHHGTTVVSLETGVTKRFPLPTSLQQFEHVLQEEMCKIPLETVRNLYEPCPSSAVVLKTRKGGPPC
jgi:hypothetical protein